MVLSFLAMNEDRHTHKHYTLLSLVTITMTNLTLCLMYPKAVITVEGTPSYSCSASELQRVYLDCVLPNWQRAVCRWCKDNSYNGECVDWDVKYKKGRKGEWETCPNLEACTCSVPGDIRHMMTFNISSLSSFGQTQEIFEVDFTNRSLIVPGPVNKLKVIHNGNDSRSMTVTFEEAYHLESVSLVFNITMKSKFDTKILVANRSSIMSSSRHHSAEFNDLIPYTNYETSVKVRPEEGTYWSDTATTSGRTLSDVPARNPETRPSSFQYHLHPSAYRTLIIYYKDIPEKYTQGIIGGMRATFTDGKTHQRYTRDCSFAKDRKCELDKARLTSNFSVEITGSTDVGFGPRFPTSAMTIPEYNEGLSKVPEHLVGEIQNMTDKKAVVLFEWSYDGETQDAFVLYYRRMLHNVAQGGVSWFVLNGTQNRAEVVIDNGGSNLQNYQFAVAAEKSGQSAGMSKPFLQCLYQKDGEKPVIQKLIFKPESQEQNSLVVVLQPQQCKPGHKQIRDLIITVLEVTTVGEIKRGGLNKTEKVPAPRVPQTYLVAELKDSTLYNISLTAVCRDGSKCQHSPGVQLVTKPPQPYEFPDWAYVVILVIFAVVLLLGIGTYWFYRRTTSKKKQLRIQRTPAVMLQAQPLEENSTPDEYYAITIDNMPHRERSGSESSCSDGDYCTRELNQLILNGKPSGGSGSANNPGDISNQPAEADSGGIADRSQRHLNPAFQLPSLQPVPEADEDNMNYLNGVVCLDSADQHGHYIANNQKQWLSSQTAPDYFLPNLEALHDAEVLHPKTNAKNECDSRSRDEEGGTSTSGESDEDDEYAKVTTRQPCLDLGRSETKSTGHPLSNNVDDLDDDGHSKPRSSPEESASDHEKKCVSPSKFDSDILDHDLESLTRSPVESRAVFPWFDRGEYDSEDDSSISSATSDSVPHSEGEFLPSVLQGMPIDGGYISRPDQRQDPTSYLQNTFQIRVK